MHFRRDIRFSERNNVEYSIREKIKRRERENCRREREREKERNC